MDNVKRKVSQATNLHDRLIGNVELCLIHLRYKRGVMIGPPRYRHPVYARSLGCFFMASADDQRIDGGELGAREIV